MIDDARYKDRNLGDSARQRVVYLLPCSVSPTLLLQKGHEAL
jgi:hypothetical protein